MSSNSSSRPIGQLHSLAEERGTSFMEWIIRSGLTEDRRVMQWAVTLYPSLAAWAGRLDDFHWFVNTAEQRKKDD